MTQGYQLEHSLSLRLFKSVFDTIDNVYQLEHSLSFRLLSVFDNVDNNGHQKVRWIPMLEQDLSYKTGLNMSSTCPRCLWESANLGVLKPPSQVFHSIFNSQRNDVQMINRVF